MPVTINSGLVDTADPLSNELKIDMREKIAMLDPDVSQFSTMLMKLPQEKARSFKVEWLNDQLLPRVSGLAASATSAATTFTTTTDEGNYFKVGDIVRIPSTGEAVRVTGASASALTVVRGVGAVTAASAASGGAGTLIIVGGSNEQGATLPTAMITQRTTNYNYTSIVRDAARFTETALATEWYGGDLMQDKEIGKKAVEHKANLENNLFFGARSYSASNPPRHTAGGLIEYISTNITDAGGTFDKGELQDFLRTGLQHGSNRKVLFAAPIVAQVISEFLQDNWVRTKQNERLWGAKVDAVISAIYGSDIPVVVKRQWGANGIGTSGQYGSVAFLVDMENVQFAPLRPTALKRDRQARDADEQAFEYVSEVSLKVEREETHALLKNVNG
jgi:hypothetical protein